MTAISHARCASRAHGLGQVVHEACLEGDPIDQAVRVAVQNQLTAEGGRVRDVISSSDGHRGYRTGNLRVPRI